MTGISLVAEGLSIKLARLIGAAVTGTVLGIAYLSIVSQEHLDSSLDSDGSNII